MWKLIYTRSLDLVESIVYVCSFEVLLKYLEFLNSVVSPDEIDSFLIVKMDGD